MSNLYAFINCLVLWVIYMFENADGTCSQAKLKTDATCSQAKLKTNVIPISIFSIVQFSCQSGSVLCVDKNTA